MAFFHDVRAGETYRTALTERDPPYLSESAAASAYLYRGDQLSTFNRRPAVIEPDWQIEALDDGKTFLFALSQVPGLLLSSQQTYTFLDSLYQRCTKPKLSGRRHEHKAHRLSADETIVTTAEILSAINKHAKKQWLDGQCLGALIRIVLTDIDDVFSPGYNYMGWQHRDDETQMISAVDSQAPLGQTTNPEFTNSKYAVFISNHGGHWVGMVVDHTTASVYWFDSLWTKQSESCMMKDMRALEWYYDRAPHPLRHDIFRRGPLVIDVPGQKDMHSCGLAVAENIRCLIREHQIDPRRAKHCLGPDGALPNTTEYWERTTRSWRKRVGVFAGVDISDSHKHLFDHTAKIRGDLYYSADQDQWFSCYGTTEAIVWSTAGRQKPAPGRPIANLRKMRVPNRVTGTLSDSTAHLKHAVALTPRPGRLIPEPAAAPGPPKVASPLRTLSGQSPAASGADKATVPSPVGGLRKKPALSIAIPKTGTPGTPSDAAPESPFKRTRVPSEEADARETPRRPVQRRKTGTGDELMDPVDRELMLTFFPEMVRHPTGEQTPRPATTAPGQRSQTPGQVTETPRRPSSASTTAPDPRPGPRTLRGRGWTPNRPSDFWAAAPPASNSSAQTTPVSQGSDSTPTMPRRSARLSGRINMFESLTDDSTKK